MTSALVSPSRTLAAQLPSATPGSQVRIEGWVHRRRELGALTFLILRDRSGLAQVVVRDPEARQVVRRCGEETVVAVTGVATPNPAAPDGTEVTEPRITLLGEPAQAPPVDLWRPALDAGLPPHGGFAIGLERWTGRLTQAENIREVTLFPRDLHRLTP